VAVDTADFEQGGHHEVVRSAVYDMANETLTSTLASSWTRELSVDCVNVAEDVLVKRVF